MTTKRKKISTRLLAVALTLAMVVSLVPVAFAEGENDPSTSPKEGEGDPVVAVSISVSKDTLKVGESATITVTLSPDEATDNVKIEVSGDAVSCSATTITANKVGTATITANKVGTATITATSEKNPDLSNSCEVRVEDNKILIEDISISDVELSPGNSTTLSATISPSNASNQNLTWSKSTGSDKITITTGGKVTVDASATPDDSAIIIAMSQDGSDKFGSCTVSVKAADPVPVSSLTISGNNNITVNQTVQFTTIISPENATNKTVTWNSSTPSVASVDQNGNVSGLVSGSTNITATTKDGSNITASFPVTVSNAKFSSKKSSRSLTPGQKETLSLSGVPDGATASWSCTGPAASISTNTGNSCVVTANNVTAKSESVVTATVTYADRSTSSVTCKVTVTPNGNFTLNQSSINLLPQQQYTLTASSIPQGANIEWTSNNSKVKVNGNTKATANNVSGGTNSVTVSVDSGTVASSYTITAKVTPAGGTAASKTCTVKVNTPVTLSSTASVKRGQTANLTATAGTSSVSGTPTYSWSTSSKSYVKINSGSNTKTCTIEGVSNGSATLTLRYTYPTGNGSKTTYTDVSCKVTVENAMDIIKYSTPTNTDVTFKESDFEDAWKSIAPSRSDLETVKFTSLPASTYGTLYNGDDEKISTSDKFETDTNKSYRNLSKIYFSPKGKSGTITIDYTATGSRGDSYNGQIEIAIGQKNNGDITYSTAVNTPVDFDEDDFIDYCKDETGYTFDYVTFSLPKSSAGTLYLKYNSSKSNNTKVSSSTKYYRNSDPYLDDITFVPANNYTGTVSIDFTGYDTRDKKFTGTLKIHVGSQKGDVTYSTDRNKSVDFRASDFNAYCKDETGKKLDYVYFDTPASSKGTLYYDYSGRNSKKVSDSTKYYYDDDPDLDDLTFVPASNYNGSVTIPFTGYDVNGKKISGDVVVNVGETDEVIAYKATAGKAVNFATTDFNSLCKKMTGDNLDYVRFTLPASSKGTLYQTYSASGSGSSKKAASGTKYYRSPGKNDLDLNDVTFVPAGSSAGTVDISFTGESVDGDSFSGIVRITYTAAGNASVIRYTSSGTPILFRVQDFTAACSARSGAALQSVSFTPPSSAQGKLYSGYASPASRGSLIASNAASFRASGSPNLSTVAFVPKAGFTGTATINYTGIDADNASYSGVVEITVTAPKASATFSDVDAGYSWATPSIDFLSNAGIVTGTDKTHFSPTKNITRGDFVLMLYRAFGFKSVAGTERFRDVPADSYYAEAITAARAAGIATGGQDGKFRPTDALTRQDAMLLIQRALNASGQTVKDGAASALNGFPDKNQVASYTTGAVSAMVQLGVVKGDGKGNLNPGGSLTRAEMATILHRVLTL